MLRVGVVTFPAAIARARPCAIAARRRPVALWHQDTGLKGVDVVILPGGFSYGDYLRSGAIARFSPIMEAVRGHAAEGGASSVSATASRSCAKRAPAAHWSQRRAALRVRPVDVGSSDRLAVHPRIPEADVIRIPVAHGDGRFVASRRARRDEDGDQVVMRYAAGRSSMPAAIPTATSDIAGICNAAGTVVGMMPHPERLADPALGSDAGRVFNPGPDPCPPPERPENT
jgi:phosphoribosylformylglycinamidine synthase